MKDKLGSHAERGYREIVPELLGFGANPFLLAADLCMALCRTVDAVVTFETVLQGRKVLLDGLERRLAGTDHPDVVVNPTDNGQYVSRDLVGALTFGHGTRALIDDYRRFFKLFGEFLTSFEHVREFEHDPILRWTFLHRRTQQRLTHLMRQTNTVPGLVRGRVSDADIDELQQCLEGRIRQCKLARATEESLLDDLLHLEPADQHGFVSVRARYYEVWMESLAVCSCALAILGRRHEQPWALAQQLAESETHGIPVGVCQYKFAGDIYRHMSRLLREDDERVRDELYAVSDDGHFGVHPSGIVHRTGVDLLFRVDPGGAIDLTPAPYRHIGAKYYVMHVLFTLDQILRYRLRHKRLDLRVHYIIDASDGDIEDGSLRSKWLTGLDLEASPLCVYRITDKDQFSGVAVLLSPDQGLVRTFSASQDEVPYTVRRTSEDYHRSMRSAFSHMIVAREGCELLRLELSPEGGVRLGPG